MPLLSVVVPAYNEERMIAKAAEKIDVILSDNGIDYEIIFVDDGSKDNTWLEIQNVCKINDKVHGIKFSRNFGKEAGILAGLGNIQGDCAVVIDCDLQHPPETMVEMYALWQQGFHIIEGVKSSRGKETLGYKMSSKIFYRIMSKVTKIDMANASDYKLLDKEAVTALLSLPERNSFFRALSAWIGYKTATVYYEVQERTAGDSKWSTFGLIKYALSNVVAFSSVPMQFVTFAGIITFLIGFGVGIQSMYKYFTHQALEGFTTVILLILLIGSIIMFSLGVIGYYIAKIYEEVKGRPQYIISQKI